MYYFKYKVYIYIKRKEKEMGRQRKQQSLQNQKKQEEQKSQINRYSVALTSCVIAAIISSAFSAFTAWNTNEKLKDIEIRKHQYELQETRYEKLQDSLEFFSGFEVYDPKYIYRFDINSEDYSIDCFMDMYYNSSQEFLSQASLIIPYLSDEAIDILEVNGFNPEEGWREYEIDISILCDDTKINAAVKEHLNLVNDEFDSKKAVIMQALIHDISRHYIYFQP